MSKLSCRTKSIKSKLFRKLGYQSFGGLDYFGTIFVDTDRDNDFIGLVFGYQSSSKFYAVMWKKAGQVYWHRKPFVVTSKAGLTIKVKLICFFHNTNKHLQTQTKPSSPSLTFYIRFNTFIGQPLTNVYMMAPFKALRC